jgi:hypothetical protein
LYKPEKYIERLRNVQQASQAFLDAANSDAQTARSIAAQTFGLRGQAYDNFEGSFREYMQGGLLDIGGDGKYPLIDPATNEPYRVVHNGRLWQNNHQGGLNVWEPGVFGWTDLGIV